METARARHAKLVLLMSLLLIASHAAAQTNLIGDSGFEGLTLIDGVPTDFGVWGSDGPKNVVGAEFGIVPFEGSSMLRFDDATGSLYQLVDLSGEQAKIATGLARLSIGGRHKPVGPIDTSVDSYNWIVQTHSGPVSDFATGSATTLSSTTATQSVGAGPDWGGGVLVIGIPVNTEWISLTLEAPAGGYVHDQLYFDAFGASVTVPTVSGNATLLYDPTTGRVILDGNGAPGNRLLTFNLTSASGAFIAEAFINPFPPNLFTASQPTNIGATDTTIVGVPFADIGAILPPGLSLAQLHGAITSATYVGELGTGVRDFDIALIPEPAAAAITIVSVAAIARPRRLRCPA